MHRLKLYGPLIGLMITILLICDALAFKVVSIYGYDFSASGLIFPLGFLLASIITEVYGFTLAGRIIWVQLLCQASFILTVNLFVLLPSPDGSITGLHYLNLYQNLWRVLIAATIALVSAYFVNDIIMSKLKIYLSGKYFIIRFFISNAIGTAILVSISYPVNLYGLYSIDHIAIIALNTWAYKMVLAAILFPVAILLANAIKHIEKLDYFDYGISYNPINVFSENVHGENKYDKTNNDGWSHEGYSNK
jgi:queuosine precursor transporter